MEGSNVDAGDYDDHRGKPEAEPPRQQQPIRGKSAVIAVNAVMLGKILLAPFFSFNPLFCERKIRACA
jgi:hypothetical protein